MRIRSTWRGLLAVAAVAAGTVSAPNFDGACAQSADAAVDVAPAADESPPLFNELQGALIDVDGLLGSGAAATAALLRLVPGLRVDEAAASGGLLTYEWTTSAPVEAAVGLDQFALPAPRTYFADRMRMLERSTAGSEQPGRQADPLFDAELRSLQADMAIVRAAFLDCRFPSIGETWLLRRQAERLLADWRSLPDRTGEELDRKRAAFQRYDAARRGIDEADRAHRAACLARIAAVIAAPPSLGAMDVADDSERCRKLKEEIEALRSELDRLQRFAAHNESALAASAAEVLRAEQELERLRQADPQPAAVARAQAARDAAAQALDRVRADIRALTDRRTRLLLQLPDGARILEAFEQFTASSMTDDDKREFVEAVGGRPMRGAVTQDDVDKAEFEARRQIGVRFVWGLAKLGEVATKLPTDLGDTLGMGLQFALDELLEHFQAPDADDPFFLDDPGLKGRLLDASGRAGAQSARVRELVDRIAAKQKELARRAAEGADAQTLNEEASSVIPLARQLVQALTALRAELRAAAPALEEALRLADERLADLKRKRQALDERIAEYEAALDMQRNRITPGFERELAKLREQIAAKEAQLASRQADYERLCGKL